ncbi:hypothetical protein WISP_65046 [Willisornis vidua]|uniref:ribonuclease H n=1 Tax=Willisornis vidua TaxID=1566151 RepID=A0ABQ9D979_9PASS|nr:hypothetical protein WISP_65046 [Willisornis vidua]
MVKKHNTWALLPEMIKLKKKLQRAIDGLLVWLQWLQRDLNNYLPCLAFQKIPLLWDWCKSKTNKCQLSPELCIDGNTEQRETLIPIHKLIRELESQGVVSKTHSPFNSAIWPVRKSDGEWRLTVDYRGLNEVTPLLSAAVPDMLELQYELESKAAKCYATIDIANAFFSIPLAPEGRPQFAFTWRGVQYTWNQLPQG